MRRGWFLTRKDRKTISESQTPVMRSKQRASWAIEPPSRTLASNSGLSFTLNVLRGRLRTIRRLAIGCGAISKNMKKALTAIHLRDLCLTGPSKTQGSFLPSGVPKTLVILVTAIHVLNYSA